MSLQDKLPLQYNDIAQGEFDKMMQQAFLKAHRVAAEYNQKVEITGKISVYPPDPRMPTNGNVSFSVKIKEPEYTSQRFTTALSGGIPINEGRTVAEAETMDLFDVEMQDATEEDFPEIISHEQQKPEVL